MDLQQAKTQLTAIRDNLPPDYSIASARKLMSSFENYKQISRGLGRDLPRLKLGIRSDFDDIEQQIKSAIMGTPKKEADSSFGQAKKNITEDINKIIAVNIPE
jgi:hypothetical protein